MAGGVPLEPISLVMKVDSVYNLQPCHRVNGISASSQWYQGLRYSDSLQTGTLRIVISPKMKEKTLRHPHLCSSFQTSMHPHPDHLQNA